jgi:hypothetical protein
MLKTSQLLTHSMNLSWTTLRPTYMSAKCNVTLTRDGNKKGRKIWIQEYLQTCLQKCMMKIRSNGTLTHTVHLKPGPALGTHIRNNASIYFDFNEPIKTNTTLNTIGHIDPHVGTKVLAQENGTFNVYPNPAVTSFKLCCYKWHSSR